MPTGVDGQPMFTIDTHLFTIWFGGVAYKYSPLAGSSSLVTVGTITTGVWNGTAIVDAYIASAATWNAKVGTARTINTTAPITGGGDLSADRTLAMAAATASVPGYLTAEDWSTFNSKGVGTVTSVSGTAPVVSSGGTTPAVSMAEATTSVPGYLTAADWTTFNAKAPTASPTFTGTVALPILRPAADSTTALKITKADGTTAIVTVDSTNGFVGIGMTPTGSLSVKGTGTTTAEAFSVANSAGAVKFKITDNGEVVLAASSGYNGGAGMYVALNVRANGSATNHVTLGQGSNSYGQIILSGSNPLTINASTGLSSNGYMTYTSFGSLFNSNQTYGTPLTVSGKVGQTVDIFAVKGNASAVLLLNVSASGNVGIGSTTPTARVHIAAGTATANSAPIKFTAGVLLTTLELGALEFVDNGTAGHLYITLNVAGVLTRIQIV